MCGLELLIRLRRLRGFEKVAFRASRKWTGRNPFTDTPDDCLDSSLEVRSWYSQLKWIQQYLEPHLGKTVLQSDEGGGTWFSIHARRPKKGQVLWVAGPIRGDSHDRCITYQRQSQYPY